MDFFAFVIQDCREVDSAIEATVCSRREKYASLHLEEGLDFQEEDLEAQQEIDLFACWENE